MPDFQNPVQQPTTPEAGSAAFSPPPVEVAQPEVPASPPEPVAEIPMPPTEPAAEGVPIAPTENIVEPMVQPVAESPAMPAPELPQAEPVAAQPEIVEPVANAAATQLTPESSADMTEPVGNEVSPAPASETPAQVENSADGGNAVQTATEMAERARLLQEIQNAAGSDLRQTPSTPSPEASVTVAASQDATDSPLPLVIHQPESGQVPEAEVIHAPQASTASE